MGSTPDTPTLLAHWPLCGHSQDLAGRHHGVARQISWADGPGGRAGGAALGNGRDSVIEIADAPELQLRAAEFSITAWIRCAQPMRGVFGDVLSKFDTTRRCGLNLSVAGSSACYSSMGDSRHVHAGIDDGYLGPWQECGRPAGDNPLVSHLVVYQGELYASTTDAADPRQACRVYRWAGGQRWENCGRLGTDPACLSVMSMLVHDGHLYAGTGIWDWGRAEQARDAHPPQVLTRVFRYEGGTTWRDLGQVGSGQRIITMASFNGALYVGLDRGGQARCFRLDEGDQWVDCGMLDQRDNFECLMPLGQVLYGASHHAIYQYEGKKRWTCIGREPFGITQIHSFQVCQGKLWIGTWPQGYVLRYEGDGKWSNTGLVGLATDQPGVAQINEINALGMHNGKLYAGVLPKAQVYRYEADGQWTLLASLASRRDWDPKVLPTWNRVLTLTSHRGMLFACTGTCQARTQDLDEDGTAGRVLRCQAGVMASHEHDIGGAWTHLAMVRGKADLRLYVNGKLSQRSPLPRGQHLHLGNAQPLRLGAGEQGSFDGAISDVRLYAGALSAARIRQLSQPAAAAQAISR